MPITNRLKNQHLLWRAAFGPMVEITSSLDKKSSSEIWKLLKETSKSVPDKIVVADDMADGMMNGLKSTMAVNQTTDDEAMMVHLTGNVSSHPPLAKTCPNHRLATGEPPRTGPDTLYPQY